VTEKSAEYSVKMADGQRRERNAVDKGNGPWRGSKLDAER
jgi:hypothetical protein